MNKVYMEQTANRLNKRNAAGHKKYDKSNRYKRVAP